MRIIAHRGIKKMEHENTIKSFEKALQYEPDMIEFDVRKTRDGKLVVHHDEKIEERKLLLMEWDSIKSHYKKSGVDVSTLEEVLEYAKQKGIKVDIELKEKGYEEEVMELIKQKMGYEDFIIKSFHDSSVKKIKEITPLAEVGLLLRGVRHKFQLNVFNTNYRFEKRVKKTGADFIAPHWTLVNKSFLKRANKHKKPVYIWTVNAVEMIHRFLRNENIFAIVTDHSDKAQEIRKHIKKQKEMH